MFYTEKKLYQVLPRSRSRTITMGNLGDHGIYTPSWLCFYYEFSLQMIIHWFMSRSRIFRYMYVVKLQFKPMLGVQGLWAGRDLYLATPAATQGLSFSGLIRGSTPFSRPLRHAKGCRGCILTRIPIQSPLMIRMGMLRTFAKAGPLETILKINHFYRQFWLRP
jgi:hypothetical protein